MHVFLQCEAVVELAVLHHCSTPSKPSLWQPTHTAAQMAHVDDDQLDDYLNDILDDFEVPASQPSKSHVDPTTDRSNPAMMPNAAMNTKNSVKLDESADMEAEFMAQLAQNMERLLTQPSSNPSTLFNLDKTQSDSREGLTAGTDALSGSSTDLDAIRNLEELKLAFSGLSGTASKEPLAGPIREPQQFQDQIAQTMNKLRESSEKATAQATEELQGNSAEEDPMMANMLKELESMMDSEGFEDIFGGFVDQLMKKEFLYEPLKDLSEKYPAWIEANRSTLSAEDRVRYQNQLEAVKEIVLIYKKLPEDEPTAEQSKEIMDLLAKIQSFGNPPDDLMKEMAPGMETGMGGMPAVPGAGSPYEIRNQPFYPHQPHPSLVSHLQTELNKSTSLSGCSTHGQQHQDNRANQQNRRESHIVWTQPPRNILVIKKQDDVKTTHALTAVLKWFRDHQPHTNIILEHGAVSKALVQDQHFPSIHVLDERIDQQEDLASIVDFVITLGGDGTLLHASSLFPRRVPPIMSFSLGSVGFLLPFDIADYEVALARMFCGHGVPIMNRMRLAFSLQTSKSERGEFEGFQIMNELTVHRGKHAQLTAIDIFVGNDFLTDVVADGLIISTPTGSTAYSLSAGGPIVHPSVEAILLTPICPRSLSFRPIVLPANAEISIKLSAVARGDAEVAIDGRDICLLGPNKHIEVRPSEFSIPCVSRLASGSGWGDDIKQTLRWNQSFLKAGLSFN
ncbi:hypothetical protein BASA50_006540 [Batrachochytrium salamandrivorans]|uniref:ATP-NAD kinase n=1 Tax=Batrachochytrium salamandrivorans TaxID=1357716 RepID=A0ABQ8FB14_9FUNG|nr:hypothetical protein BASA61_008293 [Batrachochytrium salamandrivorans]KAH6594591.1 hypothetical protein BASA50_006540 [Batrachochytrium salamandrivorans]